MTHLPDLNRSGRYFFEFSVWDLVGELNSFSEELGGSSEGAWGGARKELGGSTKICPLLEKLQCPLFFCPLVRKSILPDGPVLVWFEFGV